MPQELSFPARDGRQLAATLFPAADPRGTVAMASAMGVPRRLYAAFAEHLASAGLSTLTFDYRGIGGSREGSLRGFQARLHEWGELDLAGAFDWLSKRHADLPMQLVTHSVGGQIFGLVSDAPVKAAVFVGSQSGSWRLWHGLPRLGMFAVWHMVLPGFARTLGYVPMKAFGQGEDLPGGVAAEWAQWGRQPDYVWSYARPRGGMNFSRYSGPLRAYAIADDKYAPRAGVEALVGMYTQAKTDLRVVEPSAVGLPSIGHFGVFKPPLRDTVWTEIRDTLLAEAN